MQLLRSADLSELPPHARRIQLLGLGNDTKTGTTSACAENTWGGLVGLWLVRNYLRMRGEYPPVATDQWPDEELPPHARRIQTRERCDGAYYGTTSACAENTTVA